jgi:AraC family transcriptional regulator
LSDLHSQLLFASPVVRIGNVVCCAPRSAPDAPEWVPDTRIVLPRRGVFALHRHREGVVADGTSAVVLGAGEEYRVSHPADGGDECTVLVVPPELHEEAFGHLGGRHGTVRPSTQLQARELISVAPGLEADERALLLLDAVATDLGAAAPPPNRRPRYVDDARALLAADPTARWGLDALARDVHCSPFHLARRFRACTGETLGRYRLRLLLALALDRIADGETNLARLAAELGFAHHSHFTARFRNVFGTTPSEVRRIVTAGKRARA